MNAMNAETQEQLQWRINVLVKRAKLIATQTFEAEEAFPPVLLVVTNKGFHGATDVLPIGMFFTGEQGKKDELAHLINMIMGASEVLATVMVTEAWVLRGGKELELSKADVNSLYQTGIQDHPAKKSAIICNVRIKGADEQLYMLDINDETKEVSDPVQVNSEPGSLRGRFTTGGIPPNATIQ